MDNQAHDQSAPSPVAPFHLLDRSDPAWKALYSLYNPDNVQGRATGLQYSQKNRQAIAKRVDARAAAAASAAAQARIEELQKQPSIKKKVAVPHFKPRVQAVSDPLAAVPHRRNGQQIMANMAVEARQAWGQAPLPSGRLIDEQEKQRCALLMQFKGNIPMASQLTPAGQAKAAAAQARARASSGGTTSSSGSTTSHQDETMAGNILAAQRQLLQQRFEELTPEVNEREEFVNTMQKLGRLQPEQLTAIQAEVAAKIHEMRELDKQIKSLDGQLQVHYDAGS